MERGLENVSFRRDEDGVPPLAGEEDAIVRLLWWEEVAVGIST